MKILWNKAKLLLAIALCAVMIAPTVLAYPIEEKIYPLNSTKLAREDLTDVETVVAKSTNPSTDHMYSPAICVTKTGRIIVSYDISNETGYVKYSDDGGVTFKNAKLKDQSFLFANVFETETGIYLIARRYSTGDDNRSLIIMRSTDNGENWSEASTVDPNPYHTAPSEVLYLDGYVYLSWDAQDTPAAQLSGGAGRSIIAPVILKAPVDADLTVASNWTISDNSLSYYDVVGGNLWDRSEYMGVPFNHDRYLDPNKGINLQSNTGWLEGNIVRIMDPENELYEENAFYIYMRSSAGTSDYGNIVKIVDNGAGDFKAEPVTTPSGKTLLYVQIPGGQSKYSINYDETSGLYWLVTNICDDAMALDSTMGTGASTSRHAGPDDVRNVLGLYYSENAMDWDFAGYVSRTDDLGQARSYASMEISGDDLLVVSRSGDKDAQSAHNTNLILLHRIKNFRQYAKKDSVVTDGTQTSLANNNGTLFYDASVLQDESVGDVHTYVTAAGTTIVTCAISDEEGTESKVLVKNEDGYYAQKLTAGYKLGEAFEANGALYVFGVADKELVAFKSTDEGATWTEPATIDNTRNWYEAPTSTLINDNKIMLALSELQEGTFTPIRGYVSGDMKVENQGTYANLCGYGAVAFTEDFSVDVGESIEVTVSPKTLVDADKNTNNFSVVFSDALGSACGNPTDSGNGVSFLLKSFSSYTTGASLNYAKVTNGAMGTQTSIKNSLNSGNVAGDMTTHAYTVKLTRVADAAYPWQMSVTYATNTGSEYVHKIPAADLAANAFENGLFVAYATQGTNQESTKYHVTKPVVTAPTESTTTEGAWTKFMPNTAWSGAVTANGKEVTMSSRAAAYYSEMIPVNDGTKVSFDVTFPTFVTTQAVQYALGLSSHKGSLYPSDTVATATVGFQLTAAASTAISAQVEYETNGSNRAQVTKVAITDASEWANVGSKTYSVTMTKQPSADTTNSWVITVTDGTTSKAVNVPVTAVPHNLFDSTGVYFTAGALNSSTHTLKISNFTVQQPPKNWEALRGYSSTAGSLGLNDAGATVFTGYGAVKYKDSYKLMPGESVSITFEPKVLKAGAANMFSVMFGDTNNSFFGRPADDKGSGISFKLQSNGQYTGGGTVRYNMITNGTAGTDGYLRNAANSAGFAGDMTQNSFTISLSRTWNQEKPWKLTMTTTANDSTYTYEVPATDLAANAFDNGVYISAGALVLNPADPTITYHVSDVTHVAHTATATAEDAYKVSPVVMTAALTADLTQAASWTYMDGISLANKVGSVYTNNKMDYFGLPYEDVDARTIGWTDLKLLKLYNSDDIRYNTATGNLFGYMTFTEAGYNYAAFVKVNTSTNKIEFFTPDSQINGVVEEEFVFAKLPGGNNGFDIMYDTANKLYWLVTTVNTDSVNTTNKSATKIAIYHSKNAYDWTYGGKVADVSGDVRVSAAFSGDDIVITAVDGGVVNYIVPQYERLADVYNWTALRGYSGSTGSLETGKQGQLILDGYGAVNCGTKIETQENTEISFVVKATDLTNTGSFFSFGLLDREGSFFGGSADKGNGFVISILPWGGHNGARYIYSAVKGGAVSPAIANGQQIGGQFAAEIVGNEITVKFIKRTQVINSVAYTWTVEITDKNGNNFRTMNIPASDVGADLFANGCYMVAGCCNNIDVTYEIDNVKVKQYVTGDINLDGEINVMDIAAIDYKYRQAGGNQNLYAAYEKVLYDINDDGKCDTTDVAMVRSMVLNNEAVSESEAAAGATTGNVRLERKYYQKNGVDMTDITINTDFICGGMEGIFTYDSTKLTYKGMSCRISNNIRNYESIAVNNGSNGLMVVALGNAKYGTQGNIITLTFEGQIKEWNQFSMESAVFTGADGKEQIKTTFYDLLLGDVTGDKKDFAIDAKDLVRMKKLIANERSSKNADLNRDNKDVPDATDCQLLREYLCGKITEF